MRLSVIFANFVFALHVVNARMIHKRDVTAPTQQVITDMTATGSQCTVVANSINSYTASQGYLGALTIESQDSTLISKLTTCSTDCSAIPGTMSNEDTEAVISELDPLSGQFENVMYALRDKKSVFDTVNLVTPLFKSDLNTLCTKFEAFGTCLLNICPSDYTETMQRYIDIAENACYVVIPFYN